MQFRPYFRIFVLVLAPVGVVVAFVLFMLHNSIVGGLIHFCPITLQMKTQLESRLGWGGVRHYRPELVQFLIDEGYWAPLDNAEPRWILTANWHHLSRGGTSQLQKELGGRGAEWIQWTRTNRQFADVLWPRALKTLRSPDADEVSHHAAAILMYARISPNREAFERLLADEGL